MNSLSGSDSPVTFKAGSIIFGEGKPSKHLYLVKKGEVRLVKLKGQKLSVLQLCKERHILNEVAILTNKPNECYAVAKTDVELILVEQKDILEVMKTSPSWIPNIFSTLCDRLKSTREMIEEHNLETDKNSELVLSKEEEKKYMEALVEYCSRG